MRDWDGLLTPNEHQVYRRAGYGAASGPGTLRALLIVDATYDFAGDRGDHILESIVKFRNSCGPAAWEAIDHISTLLAAARAAATKVIYSRSVSGVSVAGGWARKNARRNKPTPESLARGNSFPASIAPLATELIIEKTKPSAFFGTPLLSYLIEFGVDELIVAGGTTSGCVRATAVDAFSNNLRVTIPRECVFDRADLPHRVNLFDMAAKYADIHPLDDVLGRIGNGSSARNPR